MNALKTQLKVLSVDKALFRFQGNTTLFVNLLNDFCESFRNSAQEIQETIQAGDEEKAFKLLHTLKGISGNFSAEGLYESVICFSDAIRKPEIKNYDPYFNCFQSELKRVINSVKRLELPHVEEGLKNGQKKDILLDLSNHLNVFYRLLDENDMEAEQHFHMIKEELLPLLGHVHVKKMERCIDNFDFDSVRQMLTESVTHIDFSF